MKRAIILGSIVAAGLAAAGVSAQQQPGAAPAPARNPLPGITDIEKVSDRVYKIFGAGGNTTVFVRSDGVVLVDTKLANNGQAILDQVRKVTDKPVTMIINTHNHPDHMGSNAEINTARGTVQIVAQANTARRINAMPNTPDVTTAFNNTMTLGRGADRVTLHYFGPGHTDGDAFVVFPAEKTMAAGDIYAWHMGPLIDPGSGGSQLKAAQTLTRAANTIKGVDKVIEGHGQVRSWREFGDYVAFMNALNSTARRTLAAGGTPEQSVAALGRNPRWAVFMDTNLKPGLEYGGTPASRTLIDTNVVFQELKGEPVTTNWGPTGGPGGGARPAAGAAPAGGAPAGGQGRPSGN